PRPHQPSGVDDDPDGLTSLGTIRPGDEASASSRRRPADVAQLVAFLELPQALEVAPEAERSCAAPLDGELPRTNQCERLALRYADVWIHAHGLLQRNDGPALRQAEQPAVADGSNAHLDVTASGGGPRVRGPRPR